ncbi:hypothetical protein KO488_13865 [Poseidonibacter lekithochrous]|uniref:hypothetical protein n=1 Tax=Poseidonibacter TaxID=2321187 RepID=UPI001C09B36C|nr:MULTISPECIES: hypothetical protein [Poseidonibacter]MBU3015849.1 hypothetical protein [Poseidonibacter lekithochrous]MDO6829148.1 hypothetical protein [Poseidonibacter sp. 1_MG-2023]
MMKKLLLPLILINSINVLAQEEPSFLETLISDTNDHRKDIHNYIVGLSSSVDNYMYDEEDIKINKKDYSAAYGLIELSVFQNQHENIHFDQKVKIKLKLPKLKDEFRLVFESDDLDENKDYIERKNSNKNEDFNLGLSYQTFKKHIELKAKVGIKLRSKIDPFLKLSARKTWEDIYGLDVLIGQDVRQSVVKKLETTTYYEVFKKFNDYYSIHQYTEYYWHSSEGRDSQVLPSIHLKQILDQKNHLTYSLSSNIDNTETNFRIKRHSAQIKYRHFIKKWLYIDTIPENYYSYDDNFKPRYAMRFNLGIYFNKSSYK